MKNLLIGACANYNITQIQEYLNSVKNVKGTFDKIMLTYNVDRETIEALKQLGWIVYEGSLTTHIHTQRFRDMWYILQNSNYDYILTTDVRDVVFQQDPFSWLADNLCDEKDILIASETLTYVEEDWGTKNIHEGYGELYWDYIKDKEIGNVGVMAGRGESMIGLFQLIWLVSQGGDTQHFTDQSGCNLIIHNPMVKDKIQIDRNFCLQVGTLKDKEAENNYKDYPLIHQWDRSKLFTKIVKNI
jgi:hypothetical protein